MYNKVATFSPFSGNFFPLLVVTLLCSTLWGKAFPLISNPQACFTSPLSPGDTPKPQKSSCRRNHWHGRSISLQAFASCCLPRHCKQGLDVLGALNHPPYPSRGDMFQTLCVLLTQGITRHVPPLRCITRLAFASPALF